MLTIWVCNFWQKDFGAKAAHKILLKLTTGRLKILATGEDSSLFYHSVNDDEGRSVITLIPDGSFDVYK